MSRRAARPAGPPREFPWRGRVIARLTELPGGPPRLEAFPTTPAGRYAAAHWLAGLLGCDVEQAYSRLWGEPNPFERTT